MALSSDMICQSIVNHWVLVRGARVWLGTKEIPAEAGLLGAWASPPALAAPKSPLDVTAVLCKIPGNTCHPLLPGCLA